MAQPVLHRPRLVVAFWAAALALAGCGVNESDPHRFESLAQSVASIPVSAEDKGEARPTFTPDRPRERAAPLKVELMTPHELWDAREGLGAKVRLASAPTPTAYTDPEAPSAAVAAPKAAAAARQVQLGAYSSEDGARAAWARLSRGSGGAVLSGLQPVYEAVEVGGRRLVRLKVAVSAGQAQALCRDLAASDPWCARSGAAAV
ncbi:SPOR domain-containing protein [Brevundimonas diminuta]|uniref:SPOR domain-containing protein n=1 Tax=Brevundimonas diminuta TaxID=293 RepID=UPI0022AEC63C|nr:SPOR domain-containing protein [Brevundimonas diminuta]MCZ4107435.1 SPOR domain-containing protein [Brevundimonas diminuta]